KLELGKTLCLLGHLALARGQRASDLLARASALAEEVLAGPKSELGKMIEKLSRAEEAFESGAHDRLYRGECIEDIPPAVRGWLKDRGLLGCVRSPPSGARPPGVHGV